MNCRICGDSNLIEGIDLGDLPLVNNLPDSPDQACVRHPLHMLVCPQCMLGQLTESPPSDEMFEEYCYFSSQSQTMVAHARMLVDRYVVPGQFVIEVASNDGYLLGPARDRGARVLGVDPARNVVASAVANGIPTICDYFARDVARSIRAEHGQADVIFANNVLAHVPDPGEIISGIQELLAPGGIAHIEVPWLGRMLELGAFDTIYHEHQFAWSVKSIERLCSQYALGIRAVHLEDVHGGSLHVQIARGPSSVAASRWIEQETSLGLGAVSRYERFRQRVEALRLEILDVLESYRSVGGYGAAAKAVVMLNVFGLGVNQIPWVADVSPHKQGRFIPGTGQRIVSPSRLLDEHPPACLLFAWNLAREVAQRNRLYLQRGGRFIVVVPEVREINANTLERMAA